VTADWKVGGNIRFRTEWEGSAETLEQWGTIFDIRPDEFIRYRVFTPRHGLGDKVENYCVTSYILVNENEHTRVELIHQDNRPNGFGPTTLKPILAALKRVAEMN
jgi:activator of Hsp90 ATPase-like protein